MILHCFSMPDRLDECLEPRLVDLVRRQRHLPEGDRTSPRRRRARARRPLLVETDAPYLTPQVVRKERNQPAFVTHTARFVAERRGDDVRGARADGRAQCRSPLRLVSDLPASRACAGMKAFGIRPKHALGQNFLIDSNILGVIEREADLDADDVVPRDRRRPRRAVRAPRRARAARPRRRARPLARARAARRARPAPEHDAAPRRRARPRPRRRSTRRRRRSSRTCRTASPRPRSSGRVEELPHGDALGRDGAEGGGGAVRGRRRAATRTACRRVLAQLACDVQGAARRLAHASSTRCRTSTRVLVGLDAHRRRRAEPRLRARRAGRVRAPPQGARRARSSSRGVADARRRARGARARSASPPDVRAERLTPEQFRALAEALR